MDNSNSSRQGADPASRLPSLASRIFLACFFTYLTIAILSAGAQIAQQYHALRQQVDHDLEIFSHSISGPLASALWSFDQGDIRTAALGLLNLPWVVGVEVTDHRGARVLAAAGRILTEDGRIREVDANGVPGETNAACCLIAYHYPVHFTHEVGSTLVGHLVLYSSSWEVIHRILASIALILGFLAVKIVALWFIFRLVFHRLLTDPLNQLAGMLDRIRLDWPEPLRWLPADGRHSAELKRLEHAFNRLVARLREEISGHRGLQDQLEQQVAQRTAQLAAARDEAETARAAAEAADQAKSRFLAMMSHELRTPMTGVLGLIDLMERDALSASQRETLGAMRGSAATLLTILNDILDFSRIEAGHLVLQRQDFDLAAAIDATIALFRPLAAAKGLTLTGTLVAGSRRWLSGDENRLRQILFNLVGNAIKFTDQGAVTLELETRPGQDGAIDLHGSVADTGSGIPPELKDKLFQPFAQLDDPITRRAGGTGLGLAICRRLASAMGGWIDLDPDPRQGSCFRFRLPMQPGEQPAAEPLAPELPLQPLRILLAEDVELNRRMIASMLTQDGHTVDGVADGAAAIEAVMSTSYDLILMDIHMPVLDGIAATVRIRTLPPPIGTIPIFALSADVLAQQHEGGVMARFDGFLAKPINWKLLRRTLANAGRPAPEPMPDLLDPQPLLEMQRLMTPPEFIEMVWNFLDAIRSFTAAAENSIAGGDLAEARKACHGLKGVSANFGARRLSVLAARMQASVASGTPDPVLLASLTSTAATTHETCRKTWPELPDQAPPPSA